MWEEPSVTSDQEENSGLSPGAELRVFPQGVKGSERVPLLPTPASIRGRAAEEQYAMDGPPVRPCVRRQECQHHRG